MQNCSQAGEMYHPRPTFPSPEQITAFLAEEARLPRDFRLPREPVERGNAPLTDTTKPSNPKQAFAGKKVCMSCVSAPVMNELSLAMLEGSLKYGRHNYRIAGVKASTYYDAAKHHLDQWWEGEDFDAEAKVKLHHITKAIASLTVLRDAMIFNKMTDDRPPKAPADWMAQLNKASEELRKAWPNHAEPFTELGEKTLACDPKTT
jgi:hypothetical protein